MKNIKIAFLHNTLKHYRRDLFINLSNNFYIDFAFLKKINNEDKLNLIHVSELWKRKYHLIVTGIYPEFEYAPKVLVTLLIFKIKNVPIIGWSEFWNWPKVNFSDKVRHILYYIYFFLALKFLDGLIVPSRKSFDYFYKIGFSSKPIFIIPNTTDMHPPDELRTKRLKDMLKLKGKKVILYLARVDRQKGLEYLIKAYAKLQRERNDVFLLIGGKIEPKYKKKIDYICNILHINDYKFIGYVPNQVKNLYFNLCDVYVLPSLYDPFAITVVEAMMCGKPIIVSKGVGASDLIINEYNGFIVNVADEEELYLALKKALDPSIARKIGKRALLTFHKKASIEVVTNNFIWLINKMSLKCH